MHQKSRTENAIKEIQNNDLSSFKEERIEKYITTLRHWLAVIANRNQAFSIRHKGTHQEKFMPCRRMYYILTYVRVALATPDVQRIFAFDEVERKPNFVA